MAGPGVTKRSTRAPTSAPALTGISSMATQAVLEELVRAYEARSGARVRFDSVGGVEAAKRVEAGAAFDVVVLAREAIDRLLAGGQLATGSEVDLVRSRVAVAVQAGAERPDIASPEALRLAVLNARSIGTSTGPSGVALGRLFERWGIAEQLRDRIVTPPPGVPVGVLLARGEVELGFQQYSELFRLDGIEVLGPLPDPIQIVTTFSAAVTKAARSPQAAKDLIAFMASADAANAKRRHGMEPV